MVSDRYDDWRQTQAIFPRPPGEEPMTEPGTVTAAATAVSASN
jgi:hypothetical protein